jgi:hypothetical protein
VTSELLFAGGAMEAPLVIKESPRAKVMRLRVDPRTGSVLLTVPRRVSRKRAVEWASGHRAWIEAALAKVPAQIEIRPGAVIPFRGEPHEVAWQKDLPRSARVQDGRILIGGPIEGWKRGFCAG